MAMTPMAAIELDGMPRQKPSHDRADRRKARTQQEVNMVGDQGPCKTIGTRLSQHLPQSLYKGITIYIVPKDFPAFDSAHYDMVQRTCSIYSVFSWHTCSNSRKIFEVNQYNKPVTSNTRLEIFDLDGHNLGTVQC
jgi:hypothetical protein